jgi:Tfp pilus assembly protein PilX
MTRLRKLRESRKDEGGFVIVYVIVLLLIALVIGTAALSEALSAHDLTTHDMRQRRAQQAAEAGVAAALYSSREANFGAAYNFTGGLLGLSNFLDCAVPQLNVNLQVVGVTAAASSAGICPQALTSGGASTTTWSAQGNHSYYQSEFLSNKQEQGGTGSGGVVEFPQIVSIGCDGTSAANCKNAATSNVYSRELVNMAPTGPLQTVEGAGNVTLNGLTVIVPLTIVVNGDVSAGGRLSLPLVGIGINSNVGNLTSLLGLTGIIPTFTAASFNLSITTAHEVTASGGFCTAGSPSTSCTIKRQVVQPTTTTCSACSSITAPAGAYNATKDTFTMTTGTASFPPGDYVFCNFSATGGTITAPSTNTGPVRIFILPPNSAPCNSVAYGNNFTQTSGAWNGGNFVDTVGAGNSLTGAVNGVAGAVDPSGFQVYVQGDGGGYDDATAVTFGNTGAVTQNAIIYAPTSKVTASSGVAFVGSVVGNDVTINSPVVTQDLDIGNFPLYSGVNGVQPTQYVNCDTSKTTLTGAASDYSGC